MKTTEQNTNDLETFSIYRTTGMFQRDYYKLEITREEWEDHGINEPGYYKVNKRCEGIAGILQSVWLDRKEIQMINDYFNIQH